MVYRKIVILFIVIAQIQLFGHGMVAHHHHHNLANSSHHHHDDHPESPLELAYSNFIHIGESIIFTNTETVKIVEVKNKFKNLVISTFNNNILLNHIILYQKHTFPPDKFHIVKAPPNFTHKLRGPPNFIVA
jgi:hypothetical protein